MTTSRKTPAKETLKPNSFGGIHLKFWAIFSLIFLAILLLPATLTQGGWVERISFVIIGFLPAVLLAIFAVRNFDRSLTLEGDKLIIYEFGETTVIPFDQISELMYTDLHEVADTYGNVYPAFFKVTNKEGTVSYVAKTGAWNRHELKAFYDLFPDNLKTHIDKDRAIVQSRMNSNRVGRSGFLDKTKIRNTKTALLKYAVMLIVLIALYFFASSLR